MLFGAMEAGGERGRTRPGVAMQRDAGAGAQVLKGKRTTTAASCAPPGPSRFKGKGLVHPVKPPTQQSTIHLHPLPFKTHSAMRIEKEMTPWLSHRMACPMAYPHDLQGYLNPGPHKWNSRPSGPLVSKQAWRSSPPRSRGTSLPISMDSRWLRSVCGSAADLPQGERSRDEADRATSSANPFAQCALRLLFPV
jgi:hypothetical protein